MKKIKQWWSKREIREGQIIPYGLSWSLNMDGIKRFGFRRMYAIRIPLFFVRLVEGSSPYQPHWMWQFQQLEFFMEIGWRRNDWPGSMGANFASRWMFAWVELADGQEMLNKNVYYKNS